MGPRLAPAVGEDVRLARRHRRRHLVGPRRRLPAALGPGRRLRRMGAAGRLAAGEAGVLAPQEELLARPGQARDHPRARRPAGRSGSRSKTATTSPTCREMRIEWRLGEAHGTGPHRTFRRGGAACWSIPAPGRNRGRPDPAPRVLEPARLPGRSGRDPGRPPRPSPIRPSRPAGPGSIELKEEAGRYHRRRALLPLDVRQGHGGRSSAPRRTASRSSPAARS